MIKICGVCKKEFKTYPSVDKKHCSRACSFKRVKMETYKKYKCVCGECGCEFLPPRPREGAIFCSYKCRGVNARKDKVDRNGYWYVKLPEHPNSSSQGYIAEHHLVMEKRLGHNIEEGMVVHHMDENKKNNDISNLQYMSDSEHKSLHANNRGHDGRFK